MRILKNNNIWFLILLNEKKKNKKNQIGYLHIGQVWLTLIHDSWWIKTILKYN